MKNKLALARGSGSNNDRNAVKQARIDIENTCIRIDNKLEKINNELAA